MNNTLENAFADLGLGDSDSDDMITPVGLIGRASRKHSNDPYGRLSDGEAVHYDTPQPSGRAHMFEDPDSDWEGYLSFGSGTEFFSSHKRGVGVAHNGRGVGQAECQPPQTGVQSARCGHVRNSLSSLSSLMSWTTMERTRWGLLNVGDVAELRARSGS